MRHDFQQVDAVRIQHPLKHVRETAMNLIHHAAFRLPHKHLPDARDAAQVELSLKRSLELLQEALIVPIIGLLRLHLLVDLLVLIDTNTQDELLRIVFRRHYVQVVREVRVDPILDIRHADLSIGKHFLGQHDSQKPGRHIHILVRKLIIGVDQLLILLDNGLHGLRVVINLGRLGDVPQVRQLQLSLDLLGAQGILRGFSPEVHG
mmetsp:Transcript_11507/g.29133  ORF Transcript_11507/g.29133 Transcript_11507/m.29133 type:complete len:206 (+) Transcript_11507:1383-2000(+)